MLARGEAWIESDGKRSMEMALVSPLLPAVGSVALVDKFKTTLYDVERSHYPGNIFTMQKFGDPNRDSRVLGWLRKAMVDELPQALEVWRGSMTLFGPRADAPEQMDALFEALDDHSDLRDRWKEARFRQKPGIISSYAIHSHRNNLEGLPESERFSEESLIRNAPLRAQLDVADFEAASLTHDIRLLGATARMAALNYVHYMRSFATPSPQTESSSLET